MFVYGKCECFIMQMLYFVSCVHPVAVINDAYYMTCSLPMVAWWYTTQSSKRKTLR